MKRIGKEAKIGASLELRNFDGTTETFRVSGFTDNGSSSSMYAILFSKAYAEKGQWLQDIPYSLAAKIDGAKMMGEEEFLQTITDIGADYGVDRADVNQHPRRICRHTSGGLSDHYDLRQKTGQDCGVHFTH